MIVVGPLVIPIRITVVVFQPGRRITNGRTGARPRPPPQPPRPPPAARGTRRALNVCVPAAQWPHRRRAIRRLVLKLKLHRIQRATSYSGSLTYGKQGPTVGALLALGGGIQTHGATAGGVEIHSALA
eukprot:scaffold24032_cov54-Phaeocystis_antarctica.AAC.2